MPARTIVFSDYAVAHPKPKRVYCDSNYAFRVLVYSLFHSTPQLLQPLDTLCYTFYQQLKADNIDVVASLLTYSEVLHVYSFMVQGGMYSSVKKLLALKGGRPPSSPH